MSAGTREAIVALRLYFPRSTRARRTRFWHRLSAPALAHHLLAAASRANLRQAMLHTVHSGYLPGERLSHRHPELTDMKHPQCLDLLDTEPRLRGFMRAQAEELRKAHAALFLASCGLPSMRRRRRFRRGLPVSPMLTRPRLPRAPRCAHRRK